MFISHSGMILVSHRDHINFTSINKHLQIHKHELHDRNTSLWASLNPHTVNVTYVYFVHICGTSCYQTHKYQCAKQIERMLGTKPKHLTIGIKKKPLLLIVMKLWSTILKKMEVCVHQIMLFVKSKTSTLAVFTQFFLFNLKKQIKCS